MPNKPVTTANLVKNFDSEVIRADAQSTCVVVHPKFPKLVRQFLEHKRAYGSEYEKLLYSLITSWEDEASRLIKQRPLTFMGANDFTLMRNNTVIFDGNDEWDRVGRNDQDENEFLRLEEYLSYDEIMLGSLMGVSGPSFFINDGNRYNKAIPANPGTFQERGIIVGLVGARFERPDRMDSIFILATKGRSYQDPRLTAIFEEFFGVKKDKSAKFNEDMYMARMRVTAELFLLEANDRAKKVNKKAHAYVVGLGLGVWEHSSEQPLLYIDTFAAALASLDLPYISTLVRSYMYRLYVNLDRH